MARWKCPNCGNTDRDKIETNAPDLPDNHPDLGLLCVARVKPEDCAFPEEPGELDANGLAVCAWQWDFCDV